MHGWPQREARKCKPSLLARKPPRAGTPKNNPPSSSLPPLPTVPTGHPSSSSFIHPHPFTYVADPNSKSFVYVIFFLLLHVLFLGGGGQGAILSRPPYEDLPYGGGIWGLRKNLAQLHTCTDCITFKLPDSKIWTHTNAGTGNTSRPEPFQSRADRKTLPFIHSSRLRLWSPSLGDEPWNRRSWTVFKGPCARQEKEIDAQE